MPSQPRLVATLPYSLAVRAPEALSTEVVMTDLFGKAKHSIKVLTPYVDPSFVGFVLGTQATVRILSVPYTRRHSNPVLERLAALHANVEVRYLDKRDREPFCHAKTVIADGKVAYIGSANMTDTSLRHHLELGLLVEDDPVVAQTEAMFDQLWNEVGLSARDLK